MEDEKNSYLLHPKCSLARSRCHNGVTKRVQQLVGGFLALGLAFAGLVAISPSLHVAIEHGGRGPSHTHGGIPSNRYGLHAVHEHPHSHSQADATDLELPPPRPNSPELFVTTHRAFEIPSIPIRTLVGFLVRLSRSDTHPAKNTSDPLPASPNHDHHSLAQSLACGCIEGSVGVFILEFDSPRFSLLLPSPAELSLERRLDTQSAGRAPPAALS